MSVPLKQKIVLAFRSGGCCAKCHTSLSLDDERGGAYQIGEAAHIEGEHDGSGRRDGIPAARYNPQMTDSERNSYKNLIYLCPTCHRTIDKIPEGENLYPVSALVKMKMMHEQKVMKAILNAFPTVSFKELLLVTQWAVKHPPEEVTTQYDLLAVKDKMVRNSIGKQNLLILKSGLSIAGEVVAFIREIAKEDPGFPERLKSGFLEKYHKLRKEGHSGDDLFAGMCLFAEQGMDDYVSKSAGLAVLMHYFESCEVFEK